MEITRYIYPHTGKNRSENLRGIKTESREAMAREWFTSVQMPREQAGRGYRRPPRTIKGRISKGLHLPHHRYPLRQAR